uniref:Family with sequence similarity 72 member A n=2 Tax=Odontoceti TaxID=9722 RepID=A0A8C6BZW2_MONMO
MPTTVARRWTKAASVQRTWGGGWVQTARRHVSQGRVPGSTVKGGCSPKKSVPQSPEEPPPTPQDPAGKQ